MSLRACVQSLLVIINREEHPDFDWASIDYLMQQQERLIVREYAIAGTASDPKRPELDEVKIVSRGHGKWAVYCHGCVLNKRGQWEHEPMPSNRRDAFIARTRFDSPDDALLAWDSAPAEVKQV